MHGLQIFEPSTGRVRLDVTSRFTRTFGYVDIPATIWDYWGASVQPVSPLRGTVSDSRLSLGKIFVKGFFRLAETSVVVSSGHVPSNVNDLLKEGHIYMFPEITEFGGGFNWEFTRTYIPVIGDPTYTSWGGLRLFYGVY